MVVTDANVFKSGLAHSSCFIRLQYPTLWKRFLESVQSKRSTTSCYYQCLPHGIIVRKLMHRWLDGRTERETKMSVPPITASHAGYTTSTYGKAFSINLESVYMC
jgi:hypothetical protein